MTPLLLLKDPEPFAQALLNTGTTRFIAQQFHISNTSKGKLVARTDAKALASTARHFATDPKEGMAAYTAGYSATSGP